MRYLLLIYEPPRSAPVSEEIANADLARYGAFTRETQERGQFLGGEALEPVANATSVRVRNGQTLTTDGPFAETKEELGGYYLLECRDLDEAIEMAAKIPGAERGSIEIRPIWELPAGYEMQPSSAGAIG
jgi:hypothetical protein